ncbi:MAG: N-acetyl-gamma-glutamyl-phosphate reductase [Clostridia bacterium]|nr:N-acetyl-gamma-glutamyl-phosphate reductase [Clostridia bacterium]
MIEAFIDGKEGTTGLKIFDMLSARPDVRILTLPDDLRKDENARRELLNRADVSFLCLPDEEAKKAAEMTKRRGAKIIDASTAHRTSPGWVYGFPELTDERGEEIRASDRVSNPGCHATGVISIAAPLVRGGVVASDYPFVITSLSGYSGAGKKTIAVYEDDNRDRELDSPRHYSHLQSHKHIPEIVRECGLSHAPVFMPVICDFYCGMCVTVPLQSRLMKKNYGVDDIRKYFSEYYARHKLIEVAEKYEIPDFIAANELSGTNRLKIYVSGSDDRIFIASVFDNLGKGASGAACENMNVMFGLDETAYLI